MNRTEITIIILAFFASIFVAVGIFNYLSVSGQHQHTELSNASVTSYTEVLVASADIERGDEIPMTKLRWEKWPADSVKKEFYTRQFFKEKTLKDFIAKRLINAGEPISTTNIINRNNQSTLAALVKPGMRAVSINVEAASISNGLINPGDIVDVILTYKDGRNPRQGINSETILCNVRVLATDHNLSSKNTKQDANAPKTVTLEVSPEKAEILTLGVKVGSAFLSLRPLDEKNDQSCQETNLKIQNDQEPVKVIRGGQISELDVSVPPLTEEEAKPSPAPRAHKKTSKYKPPVTN
jgi:pilus assembly protein CpaB